MFPDDENRPRDAAFAMMKAIPDPVGGVCPGLLQNNSPAVTAIVLSLCTIKYVDFFRTQPSAHGDVFLQGGVVE